MLDKLNQKKITVPRRLNLCPDRVQTDGYVAIALNTEAEPSGVQRPNIC